MEEFKNTIKAYLVKDGERIETVEFNLKRGNVVQSRGRFNKLTERHEDILSLMRYNASRIMKVAQLRCSLSKFFHGCRQVDAGVWRRGVTE